jgi:uncharacterized BrkB/YihY/UPF0761 family membrane protein
MTKAKLATIFAIVFLLSLGICGYSTSHGHELFGGTAGFFSFIGMTISLIGLIATGFAALFHNMRDR